MSVGRIMGLEAKPDAAWPGLAALNDRSNLNYLGLPTKSGLKASFESGRRFRIREAETDEK